MVQLPIGREDGFTGVVDLLRLRALVWAEGCETVNEGPVPAALRDEALSRMRGAGHGVWTRADMLEMEQSGRPVNRAAEELVRQRLQRLTGAVDDAPVSDVVVRAYRALAGAPSRLVAATLDDATAALRRPNLPGALGRPNWSIPLPRTLEQLRRDQLPRRIAAALAERR